MLEINAKYKKKIQKGTTFDRKGVPSTKLRFSDKDADGNWSNITFVTPGSYPCEKDDGFEFIAKSITGVYVFKSTGSNGVQYTNVNVYGEAEVYDSKGKRIGSINKDAEQQFKEITGLDGDLPF